MSYTPDQIDEYYSRNTHVDSSPREFTPFEIGLDYGRSGDEPKNPYHAHQEEHAEWMEGYKEGHLEFFGSEYEEEVAP